MGEKIKMAKVLALCKDPTRLQTTDIEPEEIAEGLAALNKMIDLSTMPKDFFEKLQSEMQIETVFKDGKVASFNYEEE